jgi:creatine kinase
MMADVLRKEPDIYGRLKDRRTASGVSLARCLKPGVDSTGHPMIRTVGIVAGDAECYDVFDDLFRPVIAARHVGYVGYLDKQPDIRHPTVLDVSQVDAEPLDPTGRFIISTRIRATRNLQGIRFPPAISAEDRLKVEQLLAEVLLKLEGDFQGEYFPLEKSSSYQPRPGGMSQEEQQALESQGLLFQEPDAALLLSSGIGRQWPQGRGVFASQSKRLAVWVNEENHMRFTFTEPGSALKDAFGRYCQLQETLQSSLRQAGHDFAWSEQLGFLTTCPSDLGTGGLRINVLVQLPLLSAQDGFKKICKTLGLQVRPAATAERPDLCNVAVSGRLGISEVELANQLASGCRALVNKELELERGSSS